MADDTAQPSVDGEWLDEAIGLHRQGRLEQADRLYERYLEHVPGDTRALRLRGILMRDLGAFADSVRLLRAACESAPREAEPASELGLSYIAAGELQAADAAFRTALAIDPHSAKALANLGAVLQYRGHLDEAVDCYCAYLEVRPEDFEVRCNLAATLADAARADEALAAFDELPAADHPALLATRGAVFSAAGQFAAAAEMLGRAVAANPHDEMALINLAMAERELGRPDRAIELLRKAVELNPDNARAIADLSGMLAAADRHDEALSICGAFLGRHPGERMVLGVYGFVLHDAGRDAAAAELFDYERLVRISDAAVPEGFEGLASFNAALGARISDDPSLVESPVSKATTGGAQTGEFDIVGDPLLEAFAGIVHEGVADYVNALAAQRLDSHPAMAYATENWTIRAWGTVLGAGGHQTPHMHPLGWLSGVYYVQLPPEIGSTSSQAGWLELGAPPERFALQREPRLRGVEPREGRLVLFPSYLHHRTQPFDAATPRISLAFDVVPTVRL